VFKHVTQLSNGEIDGVVENDGTIVAVAVVTPHRNPSTSDDNNLNTATAEALSSAHELYMARYRDIIQDKTIEQYLSPISLNNENKSYRTNAVIQPSTAIIQRLISTFSIAGIDNDDSNTYMIEDTSTAFPASTTLTVPKRAQQRPMTATTAADFFKNALQKNTVTMTTAVDNKRNNPSTSKDSITQSVLNSKNIKVNNDGEDGKENTDVQSRDKRIHVNNGNTNRSPTKDSSISISKNGIGNADDFTGDADDDDEEEVEEGHNNDEQEHSKEA
jgi:hypothetical protein